MARYQHSAPGILQVATHYPTSLYHMYTEQPAPMMAHYLPTAASFYPNLFPYPHKPTYRLSPRDYYQMATTTTTQAHQ